MERTDDLKGVFAARVGKSSDRLRVMFVLHNQGAQDYNISKVQVVRKDNNGAFRELTSDLLKLTRRRVVSGGWEYGVLSLPNVRELSGAALRIECISNGAAHYTLCDISEEATAWSRRLLPSEDLDRLFMYLDVPGDIMAGSTIQCTVNGRAARVSDHASLTTEDKRAILAIELTPEKPLKAGERVFAKIAMSDGTSVAGATKAFYPFVLGKTQFERVMRAVDISHDGEWMKVGLYNEADFRKSPVVIENVRLDGHDVTNTCQLPNEPLPPDLHYYDRDKRNIRLRCPGDASVKRRVEIDFRRLPPLFGQAPTGYFEKQTLAFCAQRGVGFEVDCGNGWGLPGGVCVYYGGLRPYPGLAEIRRLCAETMEAAPELPIYSLAAHGRELKTVSLLADCCDFVGVGQPLAASDPPFDRISTFFEYFRQLDGLTVPWAASVISDVGTPPSPEDMEWLALSALCMGSHGILLAPPESGSEDAIRACQIKVRGILRDVERLRPLLGIAHRVELRSTSNQAGVRMGFVLCGPGHLLVFAINEWCSRASFQGKEPFVAVPRHGVEVAVNLGPGWKPKSAIAPFSGQPVPMRLESDGQLRLQLPPFQVGQVVLLSRSEIDPSGILKQPAVALCKYDGMRPEITQVSSPVFDLRSIRPGSFHQLKVLLKSTASKPVTITGASKSGQDSRPDSISVTTTTIAPGATGELHLTFRAPTVEGQSATNVQLRSPDNPDFRASVYVSAVVQALARLEPSVVDFGTFSAERHSETREVRVVSTEPTVHINQVKAGSSAPVHVTKSHDARSFLLQIEPPTRGSFASSLDVELVSGDGKESLHETVRFTGQAVPTVSVAPAKVCVASANQSRKYRVCIQHVKDQQVKLMKVACDGPVDASADLGKFSKNPWIELTIRPGSKVTSNATVHVEGVSEDGNCFAASIPVVVLARPEEGSVNPSNVGASEHAGRRNREGARN